MASEKSLWVWLSSRLPEEGHACRIETEETAPGTPDVNYCYKGKETWFELKQVDKSPKRDTTPVFGKKKGLRLSQEVWFRERYRVSVRLWIIARVGPKVFFIHGSHALRFNRMTWPEMNSGIYHSFDFREPHYRITEFLRGI